MLFYMSWHRVQVENTFFIFCERFAAGLRYQRPVWPNRVITLTKFFQTPVPTENSVLVCCPRRQCPARQIQTSDYLHFYEAQLEPALCSSPQRWWALAHPLSPNVNVAAPYIRQFPSGETILSCQTNEGRKNPIMAVYLGNDEARSFSGRTVPFNVDPGKAGRWNSLFIKSATTVTAISGTTINGMTGLWAIDGQIIETSAEE